MKESTKHEKAMEEFKTVASSCKDSFVALEDSRVSISDNRYKCHVKMEDMTCTVFEIIDVNNSIEVSTFKL